MKWSWKIARIAGIDVYVHLTFFLLVIWMAYVYWSAERTLWAVLEGVLFLLALFVCVVLHEYGHALTARRFGVPTKDIVLLPIGGVARLERMPKEPRQELLVSIAGPAVSLAVALILALVLLLTGGLSAISLSSLLGGSFLQRLMIVNVFLALFNLIPAFPMDGGRVLRALLATRFEYARATRIAATLGQTIAILLGFWGLFNDPYLIFVALFVWAGAVQEAGSVQTQSALAGIPVSKAMLTEFHTLAPYDRLSKAVDLMLAGWQQDFPVIDNDCVVGILTRQRLLAAVAQDGTSANVASAMQREFVTAAPDDLLEEVAQRLQSQPLHTLPVMQDCRLVGLVTMENLGEFVMVRAALESARARQQQ